MRVRIHCACGLALVLASLCPAASGDDRAEGLRSGGKGYRVGLMFSRGPGSAEESGLRIHDVAAGGAAEQAGLKAGDLITHINGQACSTDPSAYSGLFGAADPIRLKIQRDGASLDVTIVPQEVDDAGQAPAAAPSGAAPRRFETANRIETRMDHGKPTVQAKINGQGPWTFFVDSGAGVTVIDRELVQKLGLPVVGKQAIGGPSDPTGIDADVVKVASITVGSIEFADVEVISWDRSTLYPAGGDGKPLGVLGFGLFAEYLLTFDYPSGAIGLDRGELPPVDNEEIIPFTIAEFGIPIIEISLGGRTIAAHLDTGSPASVSVPNVMEADLKLQSVPRAMGRARSVNGDFEIRGAQLEGDLRIGGHVFENPELLFTGLLDKANAANVGSRLLRDFIVTLDQKNNRLRLRRP